ncbi:MAG TPA: hypothetical protein VFF03_19155, partial [Rhodocyclaceae bacterium]|nr:hypothetical protein [Rhodocyclaceae bacterium]
MPTPFHREAGSFISALRGKGRVPPSTFLRWLVTGKLVILAALLALAGLVLDQDREDYRQRAILTTDNLGQVLDQNIAALIAKTDASLQTIAHEVARQNARGGIDEGALEEFIASQQSLLPEL